MIDLENLGTHSYIGVAPCGCVRAISCDIPGDEKDTARFVSDLIKRKYTVERLVNEEARKRFHVNPACETHAKPKQGSLL